MNVTCLNRYCTCTYFQDIPIYYLTLLVLKALAQYLAPLPAQGPPQRPPLMLGGE